MAEVPDIRRARWVRILAEGPNGETLIDPSAGGPVELAPGTLVGLVEGAEVGVFGEVDLAPGAEVGLAEGATVAIAGSTSVGDPISSVALTVGDTAVDLTDVAGGIPAAAKWARVEAQCAWAPKVYSDPDLTVEVSDRIRYRYDGTAPTATVGYFLADGDPLLIPEELLEEFAFILDGEADAADATLFITFHE